MDWDRLQTMLTRAEVHISEGAQHIARQKELIKELSSRGADVSRFQQMLARFEETQQLHIQTRDRLRISLDKFRALDRGVNELAPCPGQMQE